MGISREGKHMKKFSHFISLGYFCSVALELERMGLRSTSSPFDWFISDFKGVIFALEKHFDDFLNYDNLSQNRDSHQFYRDDKYKIAFFHEFNQYQPLSKQLPKVKEKYERRIERFYENILEPTLFIRYISDEKVTKTGKSIELDWIENNYDEIIHLIKSFNEHNDIIFIANTGVISDKIKIYTVTKDEDDRVARKPLDKNKELYHYLNQFEFVEKEYNLVNYRKKEMKRKNLLIRIYHKFKKEIKKYLCKEYIHDRQY